MASANIEYLDEDRDLLWGDALGRDPFGTLPRSTREALRTTERDARVLCGESLWRIIQGQLGVLHDAVPFVTPPLDSPLDDALRGWRTAPEFDDRERSVLVLVEQFVFDVSAVSNSELDPLLAHMTPAELYGVVCAIYVADYWMRVRMVLAQLFDSPLPEI